MIDPELNKSCIKVYEGPCADDKKQFYFVCYSDSNGVGCVDMVSEERLRQTIVAAFKEVIRPVEEE